MTITIRIGDCRALLRAMPDESVDEIVTSPPYWGLRDYGVAGQIGMEPTLGEHIAVLVEVFEECRRVLKKDGTLWLNYGDCYATTPNGRSAADTKAAGGDDRTFRDKPMSTIGPILGRGDADCDRGNNKGNHKSAEGYRAIAGGFLKPKDLCMIPNRLAIALQDAGWWVRSEIIWHKPNPMPESIRDRPATSHEKVWLMSKSASYFYDHLAVRTEASAASYSRLDQDVENQEGSDRANGGRKLKGKMKAVKFGGNKGGGQQGSAARRMSGREWKGRTKDMDDAARNPHSRPHRLSDFEEKSGRDYLTANLRNVWTIPTAAFSEAHFATFPPALVEPCIKAGSRAGGIILDPFGGAGTVGLVADRLGRDAILFELNPAYAAIAERRLRADGGMFIDVKVERGTSPEEK